MYILYLYIYICFLLLVYSPGNNCHLNVDNDELLPIASNSWTGNDLATNSLLDPKLHTRMSGWKLGSMVSTCAITYLLMEYIGVITH